MRAARQELHLSLAEVAGDRYSTSLISQIERNRVDPSQESLRYLAERLELPLEDLVALAQQQRNAEVEVSRYTVYEEQRVQAELALANGRPQEAQGALADLPLAQIPVSTRWRLAALRGQANFHLPRFVAAQRDFLTAVAEKPDVVPSDQHLEVMLLFLSLAASSRELGQLNDALTQYQHALKLMHIGTSLRYIAEAHWGLAFTAFELARQEAEASGSAHVEGQLMQTALSHAESARTLYHAIVLSSLNAVTKEVTSLATRLGRTSPDPGLGPQVELSSRDAGGLCDLLGISKALTSQRIAAEETPPTLLQIEPTGPSGNEDVMDARVPFQPGAGFEAVVTAEVISDDVEVAGRIVGFNVGEQSDVAFGVARSGTAGQFLAIAHA